MLIKAYYGHSGRKGQVGGSTKRDISSSSYEVISIGLSTHIEAREYMRTALDSDLSSEENSSIRSYSGSTHYEKIRKAVMGTIPMTDELQSDINNLDSAIAKSTLKKNTTLFRGVKPTHPISQKLNELQGGEILEDVSFQSTSLNRMTATDFTADRDDWESMDTGVVLRILAPKGTNALPILNSKNSQEQEFLLPRNSKFKVVSADTTTKEITVIII